MRILVCTKRDLHGAHFLNRLLPRLAGHELAGIWLSEKNRDAENSVPELVELRFLERTLPLELLFPLIDALPETLQDSAPDATFSGLSRRHRVPVEVITALDASTHARLAALAPDLVIVARFSHIFDAAAIALPRFGMVNIHPGRLPEFAGLHAPLRAVISDTRNFGCSLYWIDPGIDHGPLLSIIEQPIAWDCCLLQQIAGLYPLAIPALLALIDACATGQRPDGSPQDGKHRHYRSMPTPADFEALRQSGLCLWQPDTYLGWLQRYRPAGITLPVFALPPR